MFSLLSGAILSKSSKCDYKKSDVFLLNLAIIIIEKYYFGYRIPNILGGCHVVCPKKLVNVIVFSKEFAHCSPENY
jgi:uncharacterized membrane protein YfhO